jgi:drug/metabolite transporter (DMT)-like permease
MVFDTCAHLCLKAGAVADGGGDVQGIKAWISMISNKWIALGIFTYVFQLFSWFWFLSVVPLSQAMLLACFDIFLIALGGKFLFKEHMSAKRVAAISLIAVGVALVGWA